MEATIDEAHATVRKMTENINTIKELIKDGIEIRFQVGLRYSRYSQSPHQITI